jgi:hypothetical protein
MEEYLIPLVVQNPWCSTFLAIGAAGAATAFALLSPYFSINMTKMIPESESQSEDVPVSIVKIRRGYLLTFDFLTEWRSCQEVQDLQDQFCRSVHEISVRRLPDNARCSSSRSPCFQ